MMMAMACTDLPGLNVRTIPKPTVMTPNTVSSHHRRPKSLTLAAVSVALMLDI